MAAPETIATMVDQPIDITDAATWPEWLTVKQVATILQCNPTVVRALIDADELRVRQFGPRSLRVAKDSVRPKE